jgi:hypothetical protein
MKAEIGDVIRIHGYNIGSPEKQDFGKHVVSKTQGDHAILENGEIVPRYYDENGKTHRLSTELGMNLFYRLYQLYKKTELE